MNSNIPIGWIIAGVITGVLAITGLIFACNYTVVPPGWRGISVKLGTIDPNMKKEGFHFKAPMIEDINLVEIRQVTKTGKALCFSSDLQTIGVEFNVMYHIPETSVVKLFQSYSGNPYDTLLAPRLQEAIKQVTATSRAEDLVKNREQLKITALSKIKNELKDLVIVDDITINNIDLSDQLEAAIEAKVVREQEALAKKFEIDKAQRQGEITVVEAKAQADSAKANAIAQSDAARIKANMESEALKIRATAEAETTKVRAIAEAEATKVRSIAEAEATKVKAEAQAKSIQVRASALKENPGALQLEAIGKWDGRTPSIIGTPQGFNMFLTPETIK